MNNWFCFFVFFCMIKVCQETLSFDFLLSCNATKDSASQFYFKHKFFIFLFKTTSKSSQNPPLKPPCFVLQLLYHFPTEKISKPLCALKFKCLKMFFIFKQYFYRKPKFVGFKKWILGCFAFWFLFFVFCFHQRWKLLIQTLSSLIFVEIVFNKTSTFYS